MKILKRTAFFFGLFFFGYLAFTCNRDEHADSAARFKVGDTVIIKISSGDWVFRLPKNTAKKDCCVVVMLKAGRPDTPFTSYSLLKSDTAMVSSKPDTPWVPSSTMEKILVVKEVRTDCNDEEEEY